MLEKYHSRDTEYGRTSTAARSMEVEQAMGSRSSRLETLAVALATGVGTGHCMLPSLSLEHPAAAAVGSSVGSAGVLAMGLASGAGVGIAALLYAVLLIWIRSSLLPLGETQALVPVLMLAGAALQLFTLAWSSQAC